MLCRVNPDTNPTKTLTLVISNRIILQTPCREVNIPQTYKIRIKVISQKGTCQYGAQLGDEWVVDGLVPGGICLGARSNIYPNLRLLRYGGVMPQYPDPDVINVICPDIEIPVIFELKRLKE